MLDETYITRLKQISIKDVLNEIYGIEIQHKGLRAYCKIRNEKTASCCIYPTNTFYDFGGGTGGDVISLVCLLDNCDKASAMEKLSNYSGITRNISDAKNSNMLFDYEWTLLDIYPDMVSKNMNINILSSPEELSNPLADINIFVDDTTAINRFTERYQIPMNKFREQAPLEYHKFLKKKVMLPLLSQRDDYYLSLLSEYKLCMAIENDKVFAVNFTSSEESILSLSDNLNHKSRLLVKAIDDKELLKFYRFNLNPKIDLPDILSGKTYFKTSKISYFDLCSLAKKSASALGKIKVPFDVYSQNYIEENSSELHRTPHTSYYLNGECVLIYPTNVREKIADIFGIELLKTEKTVDISSQNQQKTAPKLSDILL